MSQIAVHRQEAIANMDEPKHDDDLAWSRFWLGIGCVLVFAISSILLVISIGGARAGADYGLAVLMLTLLAGIVDGIVLARRRRHR